MGLGGYVLVPPPKTRGDEPGTLGPPKGPRWKQGGINGPKGTRGGNPTHITRRLGPGIPGGGHRIQGLQGGREDGDREGEGGDTPPTTRTTGLGNPGGDPGNRKELGDANDGGVGSRRSLVRNYGAAVR